MKLLSLKRRAFTLVELLVVVFIIAVLLSIATASFTQAQVAGRNGKRAADLQQIATMLELYYQDLGFYPPTSGIGAFYPQTSKSGSTNDVLNCLLGSPAADLITNTGPSSGSITFSCGTNILVTPPKQIQTPSYKAYYTKHPRDPLRKPLTNEDDNYIYLSDGRSFTLITANYEGQAPSGHTLNDIPCSQPLCQALDPWSSYTAADWNRQYIVSSKDN